LCSLFFLVEAEVGAVAHLALVLVQAQVVVAVVAQAVIPHLFWIRT
jgi:hypothetical protein